MTAPDARHIFEVRAESASGHVHPFGRRRTRSEAENLLRESIGRVEAAGGRNQRYWIEEIDTTELWQPPSPPTPRDRYRARVTTTSPPGKWTQVHVDVLAGDDVIAAYDRNYSMLQTFEPFRQGDRMFALISPNYTATAVLDLGSGEIIAAEEPASNGFCPVGFYVPDWWDIHDGRKLPGSMYWKPIDDEWPAAGDFGFVWGCVWGDDSSWKVQYLDLSSIRDGIIRRDERFGYVKLAADPKLKPTDFIRCSSFEGERRVEFYTERGYNLTSGELVPDEEW
ncbi:MAG TPA: hypothetical protein VFR11_11300 [Micromonosporaceae bacterium]|jgi:hypothetical protein|nr:hypothetical protein [Micromonosporaceae bacterium]